MIIWKPIPGLEGFEASDDGHIRNVKTSQSPKTYVNNSGYYVGYFHQYGTQLVHRLVCLAFHPNPQNLAHVNHINGNKLDNRPENLEWISPGDNIRDFWNNPIFEETQTRRRNQISENLKKRIWITDGSTSYRIIPQELSNYPNFHKGRTYHRKEVG